MKRAVLFLSLGAILIFANNFLLDSQINNIDRQLQQNTKEQKRLQQEKTRLENQQRMRQQTQKRRNDYKLPHFGPPKNDWYGW